MFVENEASEVVELEDGELFVLTEREQMMIFLWQMEQEIDRQEKNNETVRR